MCNFTSHSQSLWIPGFKAIMRILFGMEQDGENKCWCAFQCDFIANKHLLLSLELFVRLPFLLSTTIFRRCCRHSPFDGAAFTPSQLSFWWKRPIAIQVTGWGLCSVWTPLSGGVCAYTGLCSMVLLPYATVMTRSDLSSLKTCFRFNLK